MKIYHPHPKQGVFHKCAGNEILYGGAAGPGKSHALRHEGLNWCMRIPGLHAYLFRRTFGDLERTHILKSQEEFPDDIGRYKQQPKRWEFKNGSMLHFCHCQYQDDVFQYDSVEFHLLLIDELTSFNEFMYDYLRARNRCTLDIPKQYKHKIPGISTGSNPGGVGHEFVKARWVDRDPDKEMKLIRAPKEEGGMLRCFIPGLLEDNPSITENDPGYEYKVLALPEPYRSAYRRGDWEIFMGQMFRLDKAHFIDPATPVPRDSQLYMTYDWGSSAPFSIGWWYTDNENRVYRFAEWYGWSGKPNQGLRLSDSEVAQGIVKKEEQLGISGREIIRLTGPDSFAHQGDTRRGIPGAPTAITFRLPQYNLELRSVNLSRENKVRLFRERLKIPDDYEENGTLPMMVIYKDCEQFMRTIPLLQSDKTKVEDVDTTMEDHVYDEACHICNISVKGFSLQYFEEKAKKKEHKAKMEKLDPTSRRFWEEDFGPWKQKILDDQEYERTGGM